MGATTGPSWVDVAQSAQADQARFLSPAMAVSAKNPSQSEAEFGEIMNAWDGALGDPLIEAEREVLEGCARCGQRVEQSVTRCNFPTFQDASRMPQKQMPCHGDGRSAGLPALKALNDMPLHSFRAEKLGEVALFRMPVPPSAPCTKPAGNLRYGLGRR